MNKTDKENVDIDQAVSDLKAKFGSSVVTLDDRDALNEAIAETDEALLEKFFDGGEFTDEEFKTGLSKGIASGDIVPLIMRKYLEYRGDKVTYVQNFTDVDDKIINRSREEGITAPEVSEKYIKEYFDDAQALNVRKADVHPRVSQTMDEIIQFVQDLIDKGYAYEADGDVYYRARKFEGYGKLSGQNIDDLESGARIMIEEKKEDPLDFALWKKRKEPDEIAWESPWGMYEVRRQRDERLV